MNGGMVANEGENRYRFIRQLSLLTTIPAVLLSGPVIGFFIGNYLDRKFGTSPWLMTLFILLGLAGSLRQTIRIIVKTGENSNKKHG